MSCYNCGNKQKLTSLEIRIARRVSHGLPFEDLIYESNQQRILGETVQSTLPDEPPGDSESQASQEDWQSD